MQWYKADLHIHTVLSPCADLSMGPQNIVKTAVEKELDIIAVTDHNSCENVKAVADMAKGKPLTVIPGMEVYSREEAHIICLFETPEADMEFQNLVYEHLPRGDNDPDWYGPQYIVDKDENIISECKKLLGMPTNLSTEKILDAVRRLGGFAFPAHVDRKANSLLHALGFIPKDWPIHAIEIAQDFDHAVQKHRFLKNTPYTILRSSDAHFIEQLGEKYTFFKLDKPSFKELSLAVEKLKGRFAALELPD